MEPENPPLEKENHLQTKKCWVQHVSFRGCTFSVSRLPSRERSHTPPWGYVIVPRRVKNSSIPESNLEIHSAISMNSPAASRNNSSALSENAFMASKTFQTYPAFQRTRQISGKRDGDSLTFCESYQGGCTKRRSCTTFNMDVLHLKVKNNKLFEP